MRTVNLIPRSSLRLVKILGAIFNFVWYANFILIPFVIAVVGYKVVTDGKIDSTIAVQIANTVDSSPVATIIDNAKTASATINIGVLKIELKPTIKHLSLLIVQFVLIESILILFLYNMRKILNSFKAQRPFSRENTKRLRWIGLSVILYVPVHLINYLFDVWILHDSIAAPNQIYWVQKEIDPNMLILGIIIYVISSIFDYGMVVEQENKEFV